MLYIIVMVWTILYELIIFAISSDNEFVDDVVMSIRLDYNNINGLHLSGVPP